MGFITGLFGALSAIATIIGALRSIIASWKEAQKKANDDRINKTQKDTNAAQTSDEIKKTADEDADDFRHL
jgi:UPF0716 family protein affecting phage T7 exclusion